MNSFTIEIANHVIGIKTMYKRTPAICRDFLSTKTPDFDICICESDIDKERNIYEDEYAVQNHWEGILEVNAVLRKLSEKFIEYNIFMMHGAAIAIDNKAILFTGSSGTGKTTHILKWIKELPTASVVNGDKPFIISEGEPRVCGSPWAGKESMYTNTIVPLKAIIIMERAEENIIEKISFAEAFPFILQGIYRSKDKTKMQHTLHMVLNIEKKLSFYKFRFNNYKDDVFRIPYDALRKDLS